jgi:hypothetical protein
MKSHRLWLGFGIILSIIVPAVVLFSCSGGGGRDTGQKGSVALYLTDNIADYQLVTATVNTVRILHTGSGASCDILTDPVTVNIVELANVLQLVNVADCPEARYNRLHIEFDQDVKLVSASSATSDCKFTSYKDNGNRPNILHCDNGVCELDISGAVNVLAHQTTPAGLDFDLKDFEVKNFGDPETCSVTMKVSPLHAEGIRNCRYARGITGIVSGLTTTEQTFLLSKGRKTFTVDYSDITGTQQPGIDTLLQLAQDDGLRTKVIGSDIDLETRSITAKKIYVKAEGTVSDLSSATTGTTFTLTYGEGKAIPVQYGASTRVEGFIENDAWVEVKLCGYESAIVPQVAAAFSDGWFLACSVEREDDEKDHGKTCEN